MRAGQVHVSHVNIHCRFVGWRVFSRIDPSAGLGRVRGVRWVVEVRVDLRALIPVCLVDGISVAIVIAVPPVEIRGTPAVLVRACRGWRLFTT